MPAGVVCSAGRGTPQERMPEEVVRERGKPEGGSVRGHVSRPGDGGRTGTPAGARGRPGPACSWEGMYGGCGSSGESVRVPASPKNRSKPPLDAPMIFVSSASTRKVCRQPHGHVAEVAGLQQLLVRLAVAVLDPHPGAAGQQIEGLVHVGVAVGGDRVALGSRIGEQAELAAGLVLAEQNGDEGVEQVGSLPLSGLQEEGHRLPRQGEALRTAALGELRSHGVSSEI